MDISHLYHDAAFGDPTLELDVKEQLKTRIVNAREERNLEMLSKSYERAKFICEKNTAWERWKVGQSLHGIWERSPQLDRSLALEKARVEELQRSILMKNFRVRHKHLPQEVKPLSPIMRSVSNTTLNPIGQEAKNRKRRHPRRKGKKVKEEADGGIHSITERHTQRPGDFARRTEHVVKSLAKINWRQQNRRRDHQKFKEELKLHSKPVIEKARVVLKGRSDIDVETMLTDFENILHLQQLPENHSNDISNKSSKLSDTSSTLTGSNVLQMSDIDEIDSHLPSLSEASSNASDGRNSNTMTNDSCDVAMETTSTKSPLSALESTNHTNERQQLDKVVGKNDQSQLPPINNGKSSQNEDDKPMSHSSSSDADKVASSPSRSRLRGFSSGHDGRRSNLGEVFSPSTSVSQVIIEEDEEYEAFKDNETTKPDANQSSCAVDDNNNNVESKPPSAKLENYTLTHTTGLPQLWKSTVKKKKEKALVEVSAATIARKHRKKRNESERMW